ncbi:MAG: cytochrome c maturation protein CcmE [Gammaproteobacteria bacterium]|nr:cytochrome c maturation protein CcmE [Gammaproteobacteria bacterium]
MTPTRKKRLYLVVMIIVGIGVATGLAISAFNENLMFFYAPSEVIAGEAPRDHAFRVGGMVTKGSVKRQADGLTVRFDLTDYVETVTVEYTGILPDLFREGQGTVSKGRLRDDGVFVADEVLAKHDENYMPPEVSDALKAAHVKGIKTTGTGEVQP